MFNTKDYYFTTHTAKRVLTQNESFFILRHRRLKISLDGFQTCTIKYFRQIFDMWQGSQVVVS